MPDGYDKDRDGSDNNSRGRIFENGTYDHFRDHENGYTQGSRIINTEKGRIKFDKYKDERGVVSGIEEKSGQMKGPKDLKQLEAVYELLKTGRLHHYTLRTVEREPISPPCQELIDKIRRDFPERSTHQVIDRETAREIWAKGQQKEVSKERGQQLELDKVREQAREGKQIAAQRQRDKQVTLAKAREVRENLQAVEVFREAAARGRQEAPGIVREERARAAEERAAKVPARETEAVRERAEREARDRVIQEYSGILRGLEVADAKPVPAVARDEREKPAPVAERAVPETERERVQREAAERTIREFLAPGTWAAREPATPTNAATAAREQAEREQADKARERSAPVPEIEKPRAVDKEREQEAARELTEAEKAEREQLLEVVRLARLGQALPPQEAVRYPPAPERADERHQGPRGQERGRDIGRER